MRYFGFYGIYLGTHVVQKIPPLFQNCDREEFLFGAHVVLMSHTYTKYLASLNYFVKMLARLISSSICETETILLQTDSLVTFSLMIIWRRPLMVVDLLQHAHALLLLHTYMGMFAGM